jgi:predicted DNA-binding WGR domain protein
MSLAGQTLVFTGTLQLKRADAKAKAEAAGATVGGDVTGKTTLVVNGGDGGAKLEKAKAKGIEIWDEASFMAAIGGGSSSSTAAAATTKKKAEAPAEEPAAKKPKGKGKGKEAAPPPPPAAPPASKPSGGGGGRVRKPDRSVPDGGMYAVHEDYDVKLNQTNIGGGQNNNKFYIIQVLESGGQYFAWNRWGRVGEEGQHKMEACGTAAAAIKSFEKKFKDKTKNTWTSGASRDQFVKHDGKYQLVDVEDDDGGDGAALGKLSAEQIGKGQEVLEQIKAALNGEGGNVAFLSGQFYSLIPTQTGRTAPPAIADFGMLAEKEHQLDFWLRMGFEDMTQTLMENPLEKMRDEPPPPTLQVAAGGVCDKMAIGQSQQRGQALEKAQAGKPSKKMSAELYAAIVLYTGNSIYRALNLALREKHLQVPRYLPYLRLLFSAMDHMPKVDNVLWRGIAADLYDTYEEGKVITWWSVSSCTSDENVARGFMKQLGGKASLLTLRCKTAMDITPLSIYTNEKESLLAPGTKLKVLSRKRSGNITEIHCEEVGSALDD